MPKRIRRRSKAIRAGDWGERTAQAFDPAEETRRKNYDLWRAFLAGKKRKRDRKGI